MAATLATRLHAHFAPLHDQPMPDADLLARFALHGDSGAFAALVKRHGGMVSAVCRKRLGHAQDAEDAAQAVFLALARKAARVHGTAPVAAWLYGAAVKACREVARRNRRKPWVPLTADVPGDTALSADHEAVAAVLDEVANLSDAHRAAVVLCELEGCPRGLAARRLGIAEGTLSSRLAAARRRLADRLTRRGFAPSALAALAGLAVGGPSFAFDLPSVTPIVQRITEAIVTTSIAWKLKLLTALGATTATLGLAFASGDEPKPAAPPTPVVAAKEAEPKPANFVLASHTNGYCPADKTTNVSPALKMTQVTPDGVATPVGGPDVNGIMNALHNVAVGTPKTASYIEFDRLTNAISPDGRTAMFESFTAPAKSEFRNKRGRGTAILVTAEGRIEKLCDTDGHAPSLVWSADGKTLFSTIIAHRGYVTLIPPFVHKATGFETTRIDLNNWGRQPVPMLGGGRPIASSPDSKSLLVVLTKESFFGPEATSLWLASAEPVSPESAVAPKLKMLGDWAEGVNYSDAAFSPDGKQVVVARVELIPYPKQLLTEVGKESKVSPLCPANRYQIIEIASGKVTPFDYTPSCAPSYGRGAVWSPDGTRVAILDAKRWTRDADGMQAVEPQAITFDLAGRKLSGTPLPVGDAEPYGAQFDFGPRLIGWR